MINALDAAFPDWRSIQTLSASRISAVVPVPAAEHIYTNRPAIADPTTTSIGVEREIREMGTGQLFVGSLTPADRPLLDRSIERTHDCGGTVYWMPTNDHVGRPADFLASARRLRPKDWLQLNHEELAKLTGTRTVVDGINWLRDHNVAASCVVTEASNGIYRGAPGAGAGPTWRPSPSAPPPAAATSPSGPGRTPWSRPTGPSRPRCSRPAPPWPT